nr:unnamed protein product [Spirometra erinaceieuropaei]
MHTQRANVSIKATATAPPPRTDSAMQLATVFVILGLLILSRGDVQCILLFANSTGTDSIYSSWATVFPHGNATFRATIECLGGHRKEVLLSKMEYVWSGLPAFTQCEISVAYANDSNIVQVKRVTTWPTVGRPVRNLTVIPLGQAAEISWKAQYPPFGDIEEYRVTLKEEDIVFLNLRYPADVTLPQRVPNLRPGVQYTLSVVTVNKAEGGCAGSGGPSTPVTVAFKIPARGTNITDATSDTSTSTDTDTSTPELAALVRTASTASDAASSTGDTSTSTSESQASTMPTTVAGSSAAASSTLILPSCCLSPSHQLTAYMLPVPSTNITDATSDTSTDTDTSTPELAALARTASTASDAASSAGRRPTLLIFPCFHCQLLSTPLNFSFHNLLPCTSSSQAAFGSNSPLPLLHFTGDTSTSTSESQASTMPTTVAGSSAAASSTLILPSCCLSPSHQLTAYMLPVPSTNITDATSDTSTSTDTDTSTPELAALARTASTASDAASSTGRRPTLLIFPCFHCQLTSTPLNFSFHNLLPCPSSSQAAFGSNSPLPLFQFTGDTSTSTSESQASTMTTTVAGSSAAASSTLILPSCCLSPSHQLTAYMLPVPSTNITDATSDTSTSTDTDTSTPELAALARTASTASDAASSTGRRPTLLIFPCFHCQLLSTPLNFSFHNLLPCTSSSQAAFGSNSPLPLFQFTGDTSTSTSEIQASTMPTTVAGSSAAASSTLILPSCCLSPSHQLTAYMLPVPSTNITDATSDTSTSTDTDTTTPELAALARTASTASDAASSAGRRPTLLIFPCFHCQLLSTPLYFSFHNLLPCTSSSQAAFGSNSPLPLFQFTGDTSTSTSESQASTMPTTVAGSSAAASSTLILPSCCLSPSHQLTAYMLPVPSKRDSKQYQ